MRHFILALDQGTTSTTAMAIDAESGRVLGVSSKESPVSYPAQGWVEHDAEGLWHDCLEVVATLLREHDLSAQACLGLGITNQRETAVAWDPESQRALGPAIVWQDKRTSELCEQLRRQDYEALVQSRSGLVINPYFSATKFAWLVDSQSGFRASAEAGRICLGTVDSFLVAKLTAGKRFCTDVSNASRTSLLNLRQAAWDPELCELFRVPMAALGQVQPCDGDFGVTRSIGVLPDGIPIAAVAGDQQAALFGQGCWRVGQAKCTFGTGAFLVLNTGADIAQSKHRLLSTSAWTLSGDATYALEASAFIAGAAVQWLRDGLGIIRDSAEVEALARSAGHQDGLIFVPALAGLGAPHWDSAARGSLAGIDRGTIRGHVAYAVLEGVAAQIVELLEIMEKDAGISLVRVRVDGGMTKNELFLQMLADLSGRTIERPQIIDTTVLGVGMLVAKTLGLVQRSDELQTWRGADSSYEPNMPADLVVDRMEAWRQAVAKTLGREQWQMAN